MSRELAYNHLMKNIYILSMPFKNPNCRITDILKRFDEDEFFNDSMSYPEIIDSVCKLENEGCITNEKGLIGLTESGAKVLSFSGELSRMFFMDKIRDRSCQV